MIIAIADHIDCLANQIDAPQQRGDL